MDTRRKTSTLFFIGINITAAAVLLLADRARPPAHRKCDSGVEFLDQEANRMLPDDLLRYIYWSNGSACRIRNDFGGLVLPNLDQMFMDGQKTLCMDRGLILQRPCLVYSFGVNNEWSFEESMERLGCQVYAFDPSMDQEDHDHSANIHFYRIGIGAENTDQHPLNEWRMRTLDAVYDMLKSVHGQVAIDVLKMDVEYSEWTVIPQMINSNVLDRFKQLSIEIHLHAGVHFVEIFRLWAGILKSLEDYGMVRFANRANIVTTGDLMGRPSYICFEMSWFNSKWTRK